MSAPAPMAVEDSIASRVIHARELLEQGRYEAALSAARELATEVPENRDALYFIAVSLRCLQRVPEALDTLARFEVMHPRYSRLFQERGHCFIAAHNPGAAMDAYLTAVNINVALPASWKALEVLFRSAGRVSEADTSAAHVARLSSLPPPVVVATSMFADGELYPAEQIIRQFLQINGEHVEAIKLLAQIAMRQESIDDAEILYERVLALAPDYHAARYEYIKILLRRHRDLDAWRESQKLLRAEPNNRDYRTICATAGIPLGRYAESIALYREVLKGAPNAPGIHLSIGHVMKTLGRSRETVAAYRTAIGAAPGFGEPYWGLANLKTYRFSAEEIAQMRAQEALAAARPDDRVHFCFALGKAYEDAGDFAESFRYYELGNAIKKSHLHYLPDRLEQTAKLQESICTAQFFAARAGAGAPQADPIFIVGLPRSGSTLVEQILASHSDVEGTMELADIPRMVNSLQGSERNALVPPYPGLLARLHPDDFRRLGEKYLFDTRVYRTPKPFFIDKMPNNFRHIGLIHLMLPNARIIDVRRDPVACCFSNFKQLFASGQDFTYDFDDLARYYRMYLRLMDHWNRVLPGKILTVQYENLVEDLPGNIDRLLNFCGLAFEPGCLEFHKTVRSVRTASAEQVRQPLYREGVEGWRHFEPWLGPLKNALSADDAANA
jgi:tetratricopeptide (TPR) repeat protein